MPNYFIIDNNKIINIILAESQEIAETVTGMSAVEATIDRDPNMQINSTLIDGVWVLPEPDLFDS